MKDALAHAGVDPDARREEQVAHLAPSTTAAGSSGGLALIADGWSELVA